MGRDDSPKERQRKQLERKLGRRASYDRILIVSEGSRTEPNYFWEIRVAHRLHTANVAVQPSDLGTEPIQVVQYAKALFENGDLRRQIQPRAFEQVYAVFDRDDHRTYFDALQFAESSIARCATTTSSRYVSGPSHQCRASNYGCRCTTRTFRRRFIGAK